jgi:hypothetical protein
VAQSGGATCPLQFCLIGYVKLYGESMGFDPRTSPNTNDFITLRYPTFLSMILVYDVDALLFKVVCCNIWKGGRVEAKPRPVDTLLYIRSHMLKLEPLARALYVLHCNVLQCITLHIHIYMFAFVLNICARFDNTVILYYITILQSVYARLYLARELHNWLQGSKIVKPLFRRAQGPMRHVPKCRGG